MGHAISDFPAHVQRQIRDQQVGREQLTKVGQQTLTIPALTPGLNGKNGLKRMPWYKYIKVRDQWVFMIQRLHPKKHPGQVRITYIRKSTNPMDWDNLGASFKVAGDALEQLGIIEDDSRDTIRDFEMDWERADKLAEQCSIITITDV